MSIYVILLDNKGKPGDFIVDEDENPVEYVSADKARVELKDHPWIKGAGALILNLEEVEYL